MFSVPSVSSFVCHTLAQQKNLFKVFFSNVQQKERDILTHFVYHFPFWVGNVGVREHASSGHKAEPISKHFPFKKNYYAYNFWLMGYCFVIELWSAAPYFSDFSFELTY